MALLIWVLLGLRFTWERRGLKDLLDRTLSNMDWRTRFHEANVTHLPRVKLDHYRLLIKQLNNTRFDMSKMPFRLKLLG